MICPGKYKDMATGRVLSPEMPAADRRGRPADRLEAALDACLIDAAETAASAARVEMEKASPIPARIKPQLACVFSCRLSWMRCWLGDHYTKRMIAVLFREKVAKKYTDDGWGECSVDCGAPSEAMVFRFGLLEEHEQKVEALRQALIDGEANGDAGPLNFEQIKRAARKQAGITVEHGRSSEKEG